MVDRAGRTNGTCARADFQWNAENDQYICPEGQELKQFRRNYSDPGKAPSDKGVAKCRALKLTRQTSPSKAQYCLNMDLRSIIRQAHEDACQVARDIAKTKQYEISMKLRKQVELFLADLKLILAFRRLRLRDPCGVIDECLLVATAQNFGKLAKIFPVPQKSQIA